MVKFKAEYCQMLTDHMAAGYTFSSFAGVAKVSRSTINNWVEKYPQFANAKEFGESLAQKWWEQRGHEGMQGLIKGFNATVWVFAMKNMFGWRDREEKCRYFFDGKEVTADEMTEIVVNKYIEVTKAS